jgi:glutamate racemase
MSTPFASVMTETQENTRPMRIGVFDSGVGGLTVLRSLFARIPSAEYLYLGDTARLPYGSKSQETIARYAVSSARFLVEQGAEFLVIACNTASALAIDEIRDASPVPVLGVIETGANAAKASSLTREVLVMATAATVESHAYANACHARGMRALEKACPLLVPLVEEGWIEHAVTDEVVRIYLSDLLGLAESASPAMRPDTLVLGCTHYPLLRRVIERALPTTLRVIDSAEVTAEEVAQRLHFADPDANGASANPRCHFFATDSVTKFRSLGERFLGHAIDGVRHIDLDS